MSTAPPRGLLLALALLAASLAGCLGFGAEETGDTTGDELDSRIGADTARLIESRAALVPRNYTFPEQRLLPPVVQFVNGTIDLAAASGYEDRNDRGGNQWNVVVQATDFAAQIPPGQATEVRIKLYTAMQPGSSADIDIYVDVPGTRTAYDPTNQDEFNWKYTSKYMTVSTVGVAGARHDIGVAVANARSLPGQELQYTLQIEFSYAKDVVTPYHAWALEVPPEATGLVFASVKGSGPEHVRAHFVVVDPQDDPVAIVEFDDLRIPSESVYVPTTGPGTYIFYAFAMEGGFLDVTADAPVPDRNARTLPLQETYTALASGPAPGLPGRDWLHDGSARTPAANGGTASFSVTGTFPLRIVPSIGDGATGASEVKVSNANGLVAYLQRVLRVDQEGSHLGYTRDEHNSAFFPDMLAKGEYTVEFTNSAPATEVGYTIVTYVRD